ncbi:MAG: hypothetical protein ACT4OO_11670 [Nitrospiraceae bacterium]
MVESIFCFLKGIGLTTERRLWRRGILMWQDFLAAAGISGMSGARKAVYDQDLALAHENRQRENARFFCEMLQAQGSVATL